jgi:Fe-S-cluster-containing dehydrogenase component
MEFPLEDVLDAIDNPITRRNFIKKGSLMVVGVLGLTLPLGVEQVFAQENTAYGVVLCDPSLCSGCRTCEALCSSRRYGFVSSELSLLTVDRDRNRAVWTTGQYSAKTCRQCVLSDNTPWCMTACPVQAIQIAPKGTYGDTKARVIDEEECIGCGNCVEACPYEMAIFDEEREVATKCDLCAGDPICVKGCPTGALTYYRPWVKSIKNKWITAY